MYLPKNIDLIALIGALILKERIRVPVLSSNNILLISVGKGNLCFPSPLHVNWPVIYSVSYGLWLSQYLITLCKWNNFKRKRKMGMPKFLSVISSYKFLVFLISQWNTKNHRVRMGKNKIFCILKTLFTC